MQYWVQHAVTENLTIAVKSGGHDYHGAPLRDRGILIDLGDLQKIEVDTSACRAWVEPAATNSSLITEATRHGLAFPTGHCPSVGLGGYLLAGGLGWNPTTWGPACWSVEAVEAITVDGNFIRADKSQYSDLLWAARGGASGFPAVITRFLLQLHPLPRVVMSKLMFPITAVSPLLKWMTEVRVPGVEISLIARADDAMGRDGGAASRLVLTSFGPTKDEALELSGDGC